MIKNLKELTVKELVVLNGIVKGSECFDLKEYYEAKEHDECARWSNINNIAYASKMNHKEAGGVLSSLENKSVVQLLEAKEYSLGCNCWVIDNDIVKMLIEDNC